MFHTKQILEHTSAYFIPGIHLCAGVMSSQMQGHCASVSSVRAAAVKESVAVIFSTATVSLVFCSC